MKLFFLTLFLCLTSFAAGKKDAKPITVAYDVVFPLKDLRGHRAAVTSLAVSEGDKYLLSGSQDTNVILWTLKNARIKKVMVGHKAPVTGAVFSPDNENLASSDTNGFLEVWDLSGENIKTLTSKNIVLYSVAFANGGYFLAGGSSGNIMVWNFPEGTPYRTIKTESHSVNSLLFNSPDSHLIYALASGEIKITRVSDMKEMLTIKAHSDSIKSLAYYGNSIASCSMDGYLKVWNFSDGKPLYSVFAHQGGCRAVAFSKDGEYLATGGMDNYAKLWKIGGKEALKMFGGHVDSVDAVVFSRKYLITGSKDRSIKIWPYK
ncbi:MAG: hypothetical protein COT17_06415 [Elusimicrobia bacterium CG08_land_8_20_14_0_20_51_18]|nr:MAG: hypothetical protein COT17_06415 [Elusimicrobia bacterium CG08_land_8_20_14_0_20_51_18]